MTNEIKPFIIEIYSDERMSDPYVAYASGTEDDVEEAIGQVNQRGRSQDGGLCHARLQLHRIRRLK